MVVVAIIGLLAAIAVPTFVRNARKAKSAEAAVQLRKLYSSSRVYVLQDYTSRSGLQVLSPQFPESEALTPNASCCGNPGGKCPANPADWVAPTWQALQFNLIDAHYYRYEYQSTGSAGAGPGSLFTARAIGDLNCDLTVFATFEMVGMWSDTDHDVHGSAGMYQNNPTE
jgi:type II secretory pathway pseudopilin PulG